MKDIITQNSKGQYHGYQEWYGYTLYYRGNIKHNESIGYTEYNRAKKTNFLILTFELMVNVTKEKKQPKWLPDYYLFFFVFYLYYYYNFNYYSVYDENSSILC